MQNSPKNEPIGDGKAVFLENFNDEETEAYIKKVDQGWGKFYNKIMNIK